MVLQADIKLSCKPYKNNLQRNATEFVNEIYNTTRCFLQGKIGKHNFTDRQETLDMVKSSGNLIILRCSNT